MIGLMPRKSKPKKLPGFDPMHPSRCKQFRVGRSIFHLPRYMGLHQAPPLASSTTGAPRPISFRVRITGQPEGEFHFDECGGVKPAYEAACEFYLQQFNAIWEELAPHLSPDALERDTVVTLKVIPPQRLQYHRGIWTPGSLGKGIVSVRHLRFDVQRDIEITVMAASSPDRRALTEDRARKWLADTVMRRALDVWNSNSRSHGLKIRRSDLDPYLGL